MTSWPLFHSLCCSVFHRARLAESRHQRMHRFSLQLSPLSFYDSLALFLPLSALQLRGRRFYGPLTFFSQLSICLAVAVASTRRVPLGQAVEIEQVFCFQSLVALSILSGGEAQASFFPQYLPWRADLSFSLASQAVDLVSRVLAPSLCQLF